MSAIVFDSLAYVRRVVAAGMPREQAEAQAEAMKEVFVHNIDALVTRDYLDVRFNEFATRFEASMDRRFAEMTGSIDKRFSEMNGSIDQRFSEMDTSINQRFSEMNGSIDQRFSEMNKSIDQRFSETNKSIDQRFTAVDARFSAIDVRLERVDGRFNLVYWMQGLTLACVVIPAIRDFLV